MPSPSVSYGNLLRLAARVNIVTRAIFQLLNGSQLDRNLELIILSLILVVMEQVLSG